MYLKKKNSKGKDSRSHHALGTPGRTPPIIWAHRAAAPEPSRRTSPLARTPRGRHPPLPRGAAGGGRPRSAALAASPSPAASPGPGPGGRPSILRRGPCLAPRRAGAAAGRAGERAAAPALCGGATSPALYLTRSSARLRPPSRKTLVFTFAFLNAGGSEPLLRRTPRGLPAPPLGMLFSLSFSVRLRLSLLFFAFFFFRTAPLEQAVAAGMVERCCGGNPSTEALWGPREAGGHSR